MLLHFTLNIYRYSKIIVERFGIDPVTEINTKTGNKITREELEEICSKADVSWRPPHNSDQREQTRLIVCTRSRQLANDNPEVQSSRAAILLCREGA